MDRCTGLIARDLQLPALLLLLLLALLLLALPNLSFASPSLDEQRVLYKEAKFALEKGDISKYKSVVSLIGNYPLRPYLEYLELSNRLKHIPTKDVQKFLSKYGDTSIAGRLRYRWLETLRTQDYWHDFKTDYRPNTATTAQRCYYQLGRIHSGKISKEINAATTEGLKLWTVGKSQPKGCDKLFDLLNKQGKITEPIAWQRYTSAVLNHNYQLAHYLERFFTSTRYQSLAKKFYDVDRNHRVVGDYQFFSQDSLKRNTEEVYAVITHGLSHLARVDATVALKHWSRYRQIHSFTPTQKNRIITELVKGLYDQDHVTSADNYLIDNQEYVDVSLLEWRTREALRKANWRDVLLWIDYMPDELRQDGRWRYWKTRATQLAIAGKQPLENDTYKELSVTRTFYGFLASEWLGNGYSMANRKTTATKEQLTKLKALPGLVRTRELLHHEDYISARREWRYSTRNFSEQQWITAAHLARDWQWHNGAITSMIAAAYWDDVDLRFPMAFKESFQNHAQQTGVPIHLLYAVARQESALAHDANSPAGAKGLMQLMPATAKQTAHKNGIRYRASYELHRPELNIALGSRYYSEMLKRFGNNRILATAAYNAGPHRVDRWLDVSESKLPFDAWIETIPFKETRNYVQNVLAFSVIYAHNLDNHERILSKQEKNRLL